MSTLRLLTDLRERIAYIERFTQDGEQFFLTDIKTQEAVVRSYEVIGEIVKRLPDSVLAEYPEIAWKKIKAFRDYLIHNYDQVDPVYVWAAVEDLPNLRQVVDDMIRQSS